MNVVAAFVRTREIWMFVSWRVFFPHFRFAAAQHECGYGFFENALALRSVNRIGLRCCRRPQFPLGLRCCLGHRHEFEGELVDRAGELERNFVAILDHGDAGARVAADVEAFVLGEGDRGAMFHGVLGHFLAIHGEHAFPALPKPGSSGL